MLGSKLGKNGLGSVFAFSGLFWASFVSVFLEIVGYRRRLSEGWLIRYSTFSAFQTAPLYRSSFFRIFAVTTAFSIS
jgi:hypothetical protein